MKILVNLVCLFILVFVNSEPIYGFFETPGDSLGSPSDWLILPSLVKNKLTHANSLIINGNVEGKDHQANNSDYVKTPEKILDLPVLDPLSLSSMWLLTNEPSDFINATLNRVSVTGLRTFKVKDVASNDLTKSLSILLQFPALKVTGDYEITHHSRQPFLPAQSAGKVSNDSGSFTIKIPNWFTSWFANVINYSLINSTLTIINPWCKSYHDTVIPQFTSNSTSYQCDSLCYKAFNSIASMIVNRVTSEIDSHLLKLMSLLIKEEKPIDWMHQYNLALSHHHFNQDRRLSSSSNNDIVNHMEEAHRRSKRQVPCKPGKELDEYVDSLFRFAARIIRVMEPFSTPNATIYLPEYNIKVFLYEGGATRAYSLQRRKSAWVHCSNESVSLGLTVGFENLRIRYKYRAIHDWKLLWDGDFEADLQDTKMQVQFTQTTPKGEEDSQVQQRVDRLRIWRLGKVRLIIRGLGNLTQGVGLWLSQYLNDPYNQKHLNPTLRRLEVEAVSMVNVMLKNFTVPFFTII